MFEVVLLAQAENEMSEAYEWYEEQQPGLGNRFYEQVDHYLNLLAADPQLFPIRYIEDLRTLPLNKFPFLIIYWIHEEANKVYVTAIFHTSKNPRY